MAYAKFMLTFYVLFFPAYFGTRHLIPAHAATWQLFFEWETSIPLVPWMIWPYLSLYSLFCVPLFQATAEEIEALAKRTAFVLVVGGICFVILPGRIGFPKVDDLGMHQALFDLLRAFDQPGNLVPSLHVTFSMLILHAAAQVATSRLRAFYIAWLCAMLVSVVAVHQHHLIDVAVGIALALVAGYLFPAKVAYQAKNEDDGNEARDFGLRVAPPGELTCSGPG
jgi:membrane-associated phospholipid phosphatase